MSQAQVCVGIFVGKIKQAAVSIRQTNHYSGLSHLIRPLIIRSRPQEVYW